MTARVLMLLISRVLPDMLPFILCNKKRLANRHVNRLLFPTTLDSVLRHREVGRAKDLSAPPHVCVCVYIYIYIHTHTCDFSVISLFPTFPQQRTP
jgi:hypothetical protein